MDWHPPPTPGKKKKKHYHTHTHSYTSPSGSIPDPHPYRSSGLNVVLFQSKEPLLNYLVLFPERELNHNLLNKSWTFPLGKLWVPLPCPLPSQEQCGQRHINGRNNQCQDLIPQLGRGVFRTGSKIVRRDSCQWRASLCHQHTSIPFFQLPLSLYNPFFWYLREV